MLNLGKITDPRGYIKVRDIISFPPSRKKYRVLKVTKRSIKFKAVKKD